MQDSNYSNDQFPRRVSQLKVIKEQFSDEKENNLTMKSDDDLFKYDFIMQEQTMNEK